MTYKQWEAVVQVVGVVVVAVWLGLDVAANGIGASMADAALKLVWAMGALIVSNIVLTVLVVIFVSAARREELKDERPDERDRLVAVQASRNGYVVTSVTAAAAILALAFVGLEPLLAVYALFAAPVLGGVTDAISRLIYYRIG